MGYGLNRFSEDLDFDSTKKLNLKPKIKASVPRGFKIKDIKTPKDTDTVQRFVVIYISPEQKERRLKIETSFREEEIDKELYHTKEGYAIYNIDVILDKKLKAAHDGDNTRDVVRDLFDINYIITNYLDNINDQLLLSRAYDFINNKNLYYRYEPDYENDTLINSTLELNDLVNEVLENGLKVDAKINILNREDLQKIHNPHGKNIKSSDSRTKEKHNQKL